jgi:hypothetical protein
MALRGPSTIVRLNMVRRDRQTLLFTKRLLDAAAISPGYASCSWLRRIAAIVVAFMIPKFW